MNKSKIIAKPKSQGKKSPPVHNTFGERKNQILMKNITYLLIILFSITGCCRDQIVASYKLSENDKNLIPFEQDSTLSYISQQDISFSAKAQQRKLEIIEERIGADSCDLWAIDELKSSIFINTFELEFEFMLSRGFQEDQLILSMKRLFKNGTHQDYQIVNSEGSNFFNPDLFTNIEINGFHFNDVLIFNTQLTSSINRVIYSPENGIEYIDFDDGRYLKLDR